jgi:methionyl aminopeptidase
LIQLKSPREIALMRDAGRIVAECHAALAEAVQPGVTTLDLDRLIEAEIRRHGAIPTFKGHHNFPGSVCVAVNDVICHGIPGKYRLKDGDVITVDIGATYKGYIGDSAWTYPVGTVSPAVQELMAVTRECLFLGIARAVAGNRVGDIGHAIQTFAEARGMGVVREFTGHGVGQALWEPPAIPHYGAPGTGTLLRAGMTLAIEPMITLGGWEAKTDADGWTVRTVDGSICVQYEHSVAVTANGPVVLTEL